MRYYNGKELRVGDQVCVIANTQLARALGPWNTEETVKVINDKLYIDFNKVFVIPSEVVSTQVMVKQEKGE